MSSPSKVRRTIGSRSGSARRRNARTPSAPVDRVRGRVAYAADPARDPVTYAGSGLERDARSRAGRPAGLPWRVAPPGLDVYQGRGYRRLAARTYAAKCAACTWGCEMAVEMTIDHWNPRQERHRSETFCFGPLSCPLYEPGPPREVPGRKGMTYVEEDWVDEDATAHRDPDDGCRAAGGRAAARRSDALRPVDHRLEEGRSLTSGELAL